MTNMIVSIAAAAIALAAMVATFWQTREARKSWQEANDAATAAHEQAERATAAAERQAAVTEAEVELELQRKQLKTPDWTIEHVGGVIYELRRRAYLCPPGRSR